MSRLIMRKLWSDDALEIEAVESIETSADFAEGQLFAIVLAKPVAIVVTDRGEQYALDLESQPLDLGALRQQLAGNDDR